MALNISNATNQDLLQKDQSNAARWIRILKSLQGRRQLKLGIRFAERGRKFFVVGELKGQMDDSFSDAKALLSSTATRNLTTATSGLNLSAYRAQNADGATATPLTPSPKLPDCPPRSSFAIEYVLDYFSMLW
nr:chaperonin-like RbcX protein 2, chloroplastic [Ipomoea batatas]